MDPSSSASEEDLFVVEDILALKKKGSKTYYLLKWEGYDETTWEPAENILDKEMLAKFDRKFLKEDDGASRAPDVSHECDVCRSKRGELTKCSRCSIRRHQRCLHDENFDEQSNFVCDSCRQNDFLCLICRKADEKESMYRCKNCNRIFHESCYPEFDENDSSCYECSNYPFTVEDILTMRMELNGEGLSEAEYLVKFETWSHRKCFWVPESWLRIVTPIRLRNFQKQPITIPETEAVQEDWCHIDRIVYEEESKSAETKYLVKWRGLAPDLATWENESSAGSFFLFDRIEIPRDEFTKALRRYKKSLKINMGWRPVKRAPGQFKKLGQEDLSIACDLMPYQLDGVNWLLYNWHKGVNCLLADEMGMGKTVQTIAFMEHLREDSGLFPVLVVAPSTVCENWIDELNKWSPKTHHVLYAGMQGSRSRLVEYELFNDQMEVPASYRRKSLIKNHVLITSYQTLSRDSFILKSVPWQMIIVDEAHRLKGAGNQLSRLLKSCNDCFRLLLTGTPLQNNLGELFNVLSFLDPEKFSDPEELTREYENLANEQGKINEIHELLRPRILRRTKKDVGLDKDIPPRREIIVPVSMSPPQMTIYKSILQKNLHALMSHKKTSLTNVWMELRKCVNHGYLCIDEPRESDPGVVLENLLAMSGKLELLDKMLVKLRAEGNRVLIFSQMTRMLDIIQDYLALKGYKYVRLDGQTPVDQRQGLIDEFNNPASKTFCFLLSTRAGGLGINLTTADTVIMYDHDYNPHNDLQALCRAHRIGQKQVLHIYRLITVNSIEESIVAIAKKKLVLDHVVVNSMNKMEQVDISSILKQGVQKLFDGETPQRIEYDEPALQLLLSRSLSGESLENVVDDTAKLKEASADTVSIFKDEVFNHARVWEEDDEANRTNGREKDSEFWSKFIPKSEPVPKQELGKGQRRRQKSTIYSDIDLTGLMLPGGSDDSEWERMSDCTSSEESTVSDLDVGLPKQMPPEMVSAPVSHQTSISTGASGGTERTSLLLPKASPATDPVKKAGLVEAMKKNSAFINDFDQVMSHAFKKAGPPDVSATKPELADEAASPSSPTKKAGSPPGTLDAASLTQRAAAPSPSKVVIGSPNKIRLPASMSDAPASPAHVASPARLTLKISPGKVRSIGPSPATTQALPASKPAIAPAALIPMVQPGQTLPPMLPAQMTNEKIASVISKAIQVPLDIPGIQAMVTMSALLSKEQKGFIHQAIAQYKYRRGERPPPNLAFKPHLLYALKPMKFSRYQGLYCLMLIKETRVFYSFYVTVRALINEQLQVAPPSPHDRPPAHGQVQPRPPGVSVKVTPVTHPHGTMTIGPGFSGVGISTMDPGNAALSYRSGPPPPPPTRGEKQIMRTSVVGVAPMEQLLAQFKQSNPSLVTKRPSPPTMMAKRHGPPAIAPMPKRHSSPTSTTLPKLAPKPPDWKRTSSTAGSSSSSIPPGLSTESSIDLIGEDEVERVVSSTTGGLVVTKKSLGDLMEATRQLLVKKPVSIPSKPVVGLTSINDLGSARASVESKRRKGSAEEIITCTRSQDEALDRFMKKPQKKDSDSEDSTPLLIRSPAKPSGHGSQRLSDVGQGANQSLLLTQAAKIKQLVEENQRLKKENAVFRSIVTTSTVSSSTESDMVTPPPSIHSSTSAVSTMDPSDQFQVCPDDKAYFCRWNGCSFHAKSRFVLKRHFEGSHEL